MSDAEEIKMSTPEEREEAAAQAASDPAVLDGLFELLDGDRRASRQRSSAVIALVSISNPQALDGHASQLARGANQLEEQTRWNCLNALAGMAAAGVSTNEEALAAAEDNLFDDRSGIVREAAMHYLCAYGCVDPESSVDVWPSLDEAIQCHHGNPEFNDMLIWLAQFAQGAISDEVSAALAARMSFDAEHGAGTLKMRSKQIIEAHEARK